jgi:hypothetical protein
MKKCDRNVDRVGKWHETTATCDTESKTYAKSQLPMGLIIRDQTIRCMTSKLMRGCLQVVRNVVEKWGMCVLDAFIGHQSLEVISVILARLSYLDGRLHN